MDNRRLSRTGHGPLTGFPARAGLKHVDLAATVRSGGMTGANERTITTAQGPARAHLRMPPDPRAALVLGHGAGGGVAAPDLVAAAGTASAMGVAVALIEQPYRVAGRRSPPRPRASTPPGRRSSPTWPRASSRACP